MTPQDVKSLEGGNNKIREQREEIIIALNPLLTDQIKTKYVEYPHDINKRTEIASGGAARVTESIIILRDYLLREISAKRYSCVIGEPKLVEQLHLTTYLKDGRKKLIEQRIKSAIEACKKLGIIINVTEGSGKTQQKIFTFILNPEFE